MTTTYENADSVLAECLALLSQKLNLSPVELIRRMIETLDPKDREQILNQWIKKPEK
jgi:hypothetical protein